MNILLTGATGMVGAHTARALLDAGHHLHLLLRRPEAFAAWMDADATRPAWRSQVRCITGDMTDPAAVAQAMAGADGVVHAAAAVQMRADGAQAMIETNLAGARAVLGQAAERGLTHIVHVSSLAVLQTGERSAKASDGLLRILRRGGPTGRTLPAVNESSPLARPDSAYGRSKVACEQLARRLQADGAPVQIVYPSAVVGPDDPGHSQANGGMAKFRQGLVPLTDTGFQLIDVRDLAAALLKVVEGTSRPDRFIVGGHYLPWADLRRLCRMAGGRWMPPMPSPAPLLRGMGQLADWARLVRPFESDLSVEGMYYATRWMPGDSSHYLHTFQTTFRPALQTIQDTFAWFDRRSGVV